MSVPWENFLLFVSEIKDSSAVCLEPHRLLEIKTVCLVCVSCVCLVTQKAAYQPHRQMHIFKGVH